MNDADTETEARRRKADELLGLDSPIFSSRALEAHSRVVAELQRHAEVIAAMEADRHAAVVEHERTLKMKTDQANLAEFHAKRAEDVAHAAMKERDKYKLLLSGQQEKIAWAKSQEALIVEHERANAALASRLAEVERERDELRAHNQPIIDHCNGCGGEFEPQADDECPVCKPGPGLIRTWGERQAERYRSGERWENGGPGETEDGPQSSAEVSRLTTDLAAAREALGEANEGRRSCSRELAGARSDVHVLTGLLKDAATDNAALTAQVREARRATLQEVYDTWADVSSYDHARMSPVGFTRWLTERLASSSPSTGAGQPRTHLVGCPKGVPGFAEHPCGCPSGNGYAPAVLGSGPGSLPSTSTEPGAPAVREPEAGPCAYCKHAAHPGVTCKAVDLIDGGESSERCDCWRYRAAPPAEHILDPEEARCHSGREYLTQDGRMACLDCSRILTPKPAAPLPLRVGAETASCVCIHATEQHGAEGCNAVRAFGPSCECKWNGKREPGPREAPSDVSHRITRYILAATPTQAEIAAGRRLRNPTRAQLHESMDDAVTPPAGDPPPRSACPLVGCKRQGCRGEQDHEMGGPVEAPPREGGR